MERPRNDHSNREDLTGVPSNSNPEASTSHSTSQPLQDAQSVLSDAERLDHILQGIQGDARTVAASLDAMLKNIKWCLTCATEATKEHLQCYDDAAVSTHKTTSEAVEAARSLVASSKALQNEMEHLEPLAVHVRALRKMLEQLEAHADLVLR
mmetsp:Transcript_3833/g.7923  ORF Transcript_3833/g.7923 Transcript_3833/m.7923 type:complete len:153 (+) Transcript_3833:336-794(+)|eukprot:CAMPEP_0118947010 /NCGR_PEP_ID=MMETSP1169-20130426/45230_1 /TAXON_ID=36882 /ORGANISM="Pyramimonas obovata, Strain CCMP722" /LENGTH=152 /DNA_ID=CAMNT_0006893133 /DNA_START=294 /DNA_END=752 /DNA_ORIENTATION=-